MMLRGWLAVIVLGACGSSSSPPATVDAPKGSNTPDAAAATVMTVDCTGVTPVATVTAAASNFAYTSTPPGANASDSAVKVGDVVEFMPASDHPVGPDAASGMTDPGLVAAGGATTCLKFTAAGTFHYKCTVHGFKGTVTVTP